MNLKSSKPILSVLMAILLLSLFSSFTIFRVADATSPSYALIDSYTPSGEEIDPPYTSVYTTYWEAATFNVSSPTTQHIAYIIGLPLSHNTTGAVSTSLLTLSIKAVNGTGMPAGSILSTGTLNSSVIIDSPSIAYYNFTMTPIPLQPSTTYALVLSLNGGSQTNKIDWAVKYDSGASGRCFSSDSGVNWVSDAPINYLFKVYGENYEDIFTVQGGFFENDTYAGTINVNVYNGSSYLRSLSVSQTGYFGYNGTITYPVLKWTYSGGSTRSYYAPANTTSFRLYVPDSAYSSYIIIVNDFTGQINSSTHLSSILIIGGVERTIERIPIPSSYQASLILVQGRTYIREIILPDGTVYRDSYTPTSALSDNMYVRVITFSSQVQLTSKYILIEATRPTPTQIVVNYNDTLDQTTSLAVFIYYSNYTQAYNTTTTSIPSGIAQITWSSANSTVDYIAVVTAVHTSFGTIQKTTYLSISPTHTSPFSLAFLGSYPWLLDLMPYLMVVGVAGLFSTLTVAVGMFAVVGFAGLFYLMGWLVISPNILILAFAIVILYAMGRRKERGAEG